MPSSPDLNRDEYLREVVKDAQGHKTAEANRGNVLFPIAAVSAIVIGRAHSTVKGFESTKLQFTPENPDEYLEFIEGSDPDEIVINSWAKIIAGVGIREIELGYWKGWSETKPGVTQRKEPGWSINGLVDSYNLAISGTQLPAAGQGSVEFNAFELSIIHRRTFLTEQASADSIARTIKTPPERMYPDFGHFYQSYHRMLELPILVGMLKTVLQPHEIPTINPDLTDSQKEIANHMNVELQDQNARRGSFLLTLRRQTLKEGRFIQHAAEMLVLQSRNLQPVGSR